MSYDKQVEKRIIQEITGKYLIPRRHLFSKVYTLEEPKASLGQKVAAGIAALAFASTLSHSVPASADDTQQYDFPRIGDESQPHGPLPEQGFTTRRPPAQQEPEDAVQPATPPTMIIADATGNQLFSDGRLEMDIAGYEAAVRNWTFDGHSNGKVGFGLRTPTLFDLVQLRGAGFVNYGDQPVSGGYNLSSFFQLPPVTLGVGVGQAIGTGNDHFRPRIMVGGQFGPVNILADAFYDSGSEGLGEGFDSRAVFSVTAKEFYLSIAKSEGLNFYNRFAFLNPGGISVVLLNILKYDAAYSRNEFMLSFGSRIDREMLDSLSLRESGADGSSDFVIDPTMDRLPFLGEYGEYNVLLSYERDNEAHVATAMFSYSPVGTRMFFALGASHRYTPGDNLTTLLLDVCAEFSGIFIMPSLEVGIQEPAIAGSVYVGKHFFL